MRRRQPRNYVSGAFGKSTRAPELVGVPMVEVWPLVPYRDGRPLPGPPPAYEAALRAPILTPAAAAELKARPFPEPLHRREEPAMPERERAAYRVEYTESAAATRDTLPSERQQQLARGLRVLARDPYTKASAQIGPDEYSRKAMVAESLLIEYGVLEGVMIVVVVSVLDDMAFIAPDED